jgi:hypothetical protein
MTARARHFESFVHLVDLTSDAALIAWGGFFLERGERGWSVVDDDDLPAGERRRGGTIGAQSASYGHAVVEVRDERTGAVVAHAVSDERNHVWVRGLRPDTDYEYSIAVGGRPWLAERHHDWVLGPHGSAGSLEPSERRCATRFRTHPDDGDAVPVAFLAVGDYGVGIVNGEAGRRQAAVAATMEALAAIHPVRFVMSLGDNIYHGPDDQLEQTGDEDDDWYFTFYQPYRYLIDHLPVYPTAGNHDGSDTEANDDRAQLADNFHLEERFGPHQDRRRASLEPGLFYRFDVGALVELVCVDTTWGEHAGVHYFDDDRHRPWVEEAFPPDPAGGTPWRIPFCHHPPYCAGPHHQSMPAQLDSLIPLYKQAAVRLVLSGHEHNFQHGHVEGIDHIISGAGAKLDQDHPRAWGETGTLSWAAQAHCLLIEVNADRLVVTPYGTLGPDGRPRPIERHDRNGTPTSEPIALTRRLPLPG